MSRKTETVMIPISVFHHGSNSGSESWTSKPVTQTKDVNFFIDMLPEDRSNVDQMMSALERIIDHDHFEACMLTGDDPYNPENLIRAEGAHRAKVIWDHYVIPGIIYEDFTIPVEVSYYTSTLELILLPILI